MMVYDKVHVKKDAKNIRTVYIHIITDLPFLTERKKLLPISRMNSQYKTYNKKCFKFMSTIS